MKCDWPRIRFPPSGISRATSLRSMRIPSIHQLDRCDDGGMVRRVAPLALALCLPLFPQAPRQQVQVVTTDRVDFAAGGTIRFEGSEGELNIEGWDEPQVQIVCTRFD